MPAAEFLFDEVHVREGPPAPDTNGDDHGEVNRENDERLDVAKEVFKPPPAFAALVRTVKLVVDVFGFF